MLSRSDDYPIHQTPEPLAHPSTSDRNFYDRYWFNGYARDASLFFGVALGVYPNRRVMDASLSVVQGRRQVSLHASRLAPAERTETRVGPLSLEVVHPMRALRVRVEPNETGLSCDLAFRARTGPIEEPRMLLRDAGLVAIDSTRFTQFGSWSGKIAVEGAHRELDFEQTLGSRDRSWGIRPLGGRLAEAPGAPPQFFWLWAPLHFEDRCMLVGLQEDEQGRARQLNAAIAPAYASFDDVPRHEDPKLQRMTSAAQRVEWEPGTRRARGAEIELVPHAGDPLAIALEPELPFYMLGLGYLHPEWGHGMWKGESALAGESWKVDDVNPLDPRFFHVQQLCRARLGRHEGIGVLEQLVIGPHHPSGFASLLDGAPGG